MIKPKVLTYNSEEYCRLKEFCDILNEHSPCHHKYILKNVYLDFGADIMWTTILDITVGCQVLSPTEWEDIMNYTRPLEEIEIDFFLDPYCQDRAK